MADNCKYEYRPTIGKDAHGKAIRKSFYGKSRRAAKEKAEKWMIDHAAEIQQNALKPPSPTVKEAYDGWINHVKLTVRQSTLETKSHRMEKFISEFGDCDIDKIKRKDISKFIDNMALTSAKTTINTTFGDIKGFFEDCVLNEYIDKNPCTGIKTSSLGKERKKKKVFTQEETEHMLEYCRKDYPENIVGTAIDIMLSCGTSQSETLGITWDDIDFENRTISINKSVSCSKTEKIVIDKPKNEHRSRIIIVPEETLEHIRSTHDQEYKYIIHNKEPEDPYAPKAFQSKFRTFMKIAVEMINEIYKSDTPCLSVHELRHTRATLWVEQDVNLFAIAEQMGWSDLSMLRKVYGHPDINKLRRMLLCE